MMKVWIENVIIAVVIIVLPFAIAALLPYLM